MKLINIDINGTTPSSTGASPFKMANVHVDIPAGITWYYVGIESDQLHEESSVLFNGSTVNKFECIEGSGMIYASLILCSTAGDTLNQDFDATLKFIQLQTDKKSKLTKATSVVDIGQWT